MRADDLSLISAVPSDAVLAHRRKLLALLLAMPWLTRSWLALAAPTVSGETTAAVGGGFIALSQFATGRSKLDPEIGAALLAALRDSDASFSAAFDGLAADASSGKYSDVEALEAAVRGTPKHAALLALVSAWYTGSVTVNGKERFITLQEALLYQPIADGSHIPGNCAGATNSWADLPLPALAAMPTDSIGTTTMANPTSADVVVIGSGVCGAMVAHEAVQAGLSVLMLEAGPRGERSDYWQRFMNLPATNRARGDMQSPFPQSPYAPFPMFGNDDYLILKGRDAGAFRQATCVWSAARPGTGRACAGGICRSICA